MLNRNHFIHERSAGPDTSNAIISVIDPSPSHLGYTHTDISNGSSSTENSQFREELIGAFTNINNLDQEILGANHEVFSAKMEEVQVQVFHGKEDEREQEVSQATDCEDVCQSRSIVVWDGEKDKNQGQYM